MTVAIVIPAYNEAATIREVATQSLPFSSNVIVVDDGSSDNTVEQLDGLAVTVLRNDQNLGKAATLWKGMQHAMAAGCDTIITLDGDGQHNPADIPRLIAAARQRPNHVVIASRLRKRENAHKARLFANNFADFWISWATGQWVHDSQSGFRLYPAALLKAAVNQQLLQHGFVFESEILIEAGRQGFRIVSVPIDTIHHQNARASHFRPVMDITLIVRMVAWKLFSRGMHPVGLWSALRTRKEGVIQ